MEFSHRTRLAINPFESRVYIPHMSGSTARCRPRRPRLPTAMHPGDPRRGGRLCRQLAVEVGVRGQLAWRGGGVCALPSHACRCRWLAAPWDLSADSTELERATPPYRIRPHAAGPQHTYARCPPWHLQKVTPPPPIKPPFFFGVLLGPQPRRLVWYIFLATDP